MFRWFEELVKGREACREKKPWFREEKVEGRRGLKGEG